MSALDDDLAAMRDVLVAALHDELQGALGIARITALVDVALGRAAVRDLVDTAAKGAAAVTALQSKVADPTYDASGQVTAFDGAKTTSREFYPAAIP